MASHFENGSHDAGDIDLFVEEESKSDFLKLLSEIGWLMRREPAEDLIHAFFYFLPTNGDAPVSLDVKFRIEFRDTSGNLLVANEPKDVFDQGVKNSMGQFRPSGTYALLIYLLHITLEKKNISDRHLDEFSDYLLRYRGEIKTPTDAEDWETLRAFYESGLLKKDGVSGVLPKEVIYRRFTQVAATYPAKKNFHSGFGYTVLFLGPDGAGKSTAIVDLCEEFDIKTSLLYLGEKHWYSELIGRLYHGHNGRVLRKCLTYVFYPLDLFCRVAQKKGDGRYRLFLIDRVPGFPFLGGHMLRYIYQAVIPPIDLVIRFTGDLDIIWERKKEISRVELVSEDAKWKSVAETLLTRKKITIDSTVHKRSDVTRMIRKELYADKRFVERLFQPIVLKGETSVIGFSKTRMQSLIFCLPRVVIKVPLSVGALYEMRRERANLKKAANDQVFNKYIPSYRFIGPISITQRLSHVSYDDERIQTFFVDAKAATLTHELPMSLTDALDYTPLKTFLESLDGAGSFWTDYLHKAKVVTSPIHGDLHLGNVLTDGHSLFFIDWTNYREHSCRVFDSIDFYTTDTDGSWTTKIFLVYNEQSIEGKSGMYIDKETLTNYCLWKIAKELRELAAYQALTPQKKEKYLALLKGLRTILLLP